MKAEQETTEGMMLDPDVPVVGDEVDIPSEQTETDVVQPLSCAELLRMPVKSGLFLERWRYRLTGSSIFTR